VPPGDVAVSLDEEAVRAAVRAMLADVIEAICLRSPLTALRGIILVATFAGKSVAMQIGKIGVAMPLLLDEFPVGVATASFYLSCISLLAAFYDTIFGRRFRYGRAPCSDGGPDPRAFHDLTEAYPAFAK